MTASAEGQVRRVGALADKTVAVIDLLVLLVVLHVADNGGREGRVLLPTVGLPKLGLGEVGLVGGRDTGGGEQDVVGRDDVLGSGDGHGGLDGAHNGVDGGVQAEGLLDNGTVEGKLGQILVGERGQVGAESLDLLVVEILHDVGARGETEHHPRASGR